MAPLMGGESSRAGSRPQHPQTTVGSASRKRASSMAEDERTAGPMTLRRLGKQPKYSPIEQSPIEHDSSSAEASYPSPQGSLDDDDNDNDEERCNFPNVPNRYNGLEEAEDGFITHGLPLTVGDLASDPILPDITMGAREEDGDSVIGPEAQVSQATSQALVSLATRSKCSS
jgi:hypothetical protein